MPETPSPEPIAPAVDPSLDDVVHAYDYDLPADRIARRPSAERDAARLLHLARAGDRMAHRVFRDLPDLLGAGDLVVLNDCQVVPARLQARRESGGQVEVLLHPTGLDGAVQEDGRHHWQALLKPSARLRRGEVLGLAGGATLRVEDEPGPELRTVSSPEPLAVLLETGKVPLPPYLERDSDAEDRIRYQTVYARQPGAIAAPTAGLHFTEELLGRLQTAGVATATVTLHVGPGTFLPVRADRLSQHDMHEEAYEIPAETARRIDAARQTGGRVIAVGTTTTRALEAACDDDGRLRVGPGRTRLMIRPPYRFQVLDGLITNFHLPRSTLLALVAAFCGRARLLAAYQEAVQRGYRFYSYGDAMLIL